MRKSEEFQIEEFFRRQPLEPILKSKLSVTVDSDTWSAIVQPPIPYDTLWQNSCFNAYHGRAIKIKAQTVAAYGFSGSPRSLSYLEQISPEIPFQELVQNTMIDFQHFGNGFWEVERDVHGTIRELYHVPAWTCYIYPDYSFVQETGWKRVNFGAFGSDNPSQLLHFKQYYPLSSLYGAPEWYATLESLRLDRNMKLYLAGYFENNALPDVLILLTGGSFAKEAEEKIAGALKKNKGVRNSHKSMVISSKSDSAKLSTVTLTPNLENFALEVPYNNSRDEILAAHGVPPRLVGVVTPGQLGGGGEADSQMDLFIEFTISPIQTYLESIINLDILAPAGLPADFKFNKPPWYNARLGRPAPDASPAPGTEDGKKSGYMKTLQFVEKNFL